MKYNERKGTEILKYIIAQGIHNKYYIMKSVYFADKYHLEHYGRQVNGNNFYALENGPVPSELYNLIKEIQKGTVPDFYSKNYNLFCDSGYDRRQFSISDIEALNYGISEVEGLTMGEVMDKSHDSAYLSTEENQLITLKSIVSQFENGDLIWEYLNL